MSLLLRPGFICSNPVTTAVLNKAKQGIGRQEKRGRNDARPSKPDQKSSTDKGNMAQEKDTEVAREWGGGE